MSVDYDPFGNVINGTLTGEYGFSTKPLIDNLDWYYYGFRYYDPLMGRWPNRDPIGEFGGINLYSFANNNSINLVDILGLSDCCGGKPLASGKKCCEDQQISTSKNCCSKSDCIDQAIASYDRCVDKCGLAGDVISAQGIVIGGALSASGIGAGAGIGVGVGFFVKGKVVTHFCIKKCRKTRDRELKQCEECGLN